MGRLNRMQFSKKQKAVVLRENTLECKEIAWCSVKKDRESLVMDVAGINQHGKITISLGTGDVATLKGDWDETSTDTTGIVYAAAPISFDGG